MEMEILPKKCNPRRHRRSNSEDSVYLLDVIMQKDTDTALDKEN